MNKYEELFENILSLIKKNYCYLKFRRHQFKKFKKRVNKKIRDVNSDEEFFSLIGEEINIFNDLHIRFSFKGNTIFSKLLSGRKNAREIIVRKYLKSVNEHGPIVVGTINDIRYMGLNSFHSKNKSDYTWLSKNLPQDEKIIIDLRANSGGSNNFFKSVVSYFLKEEDKRISRYFKFRNSEYNENIFTDFEPNYITKSKKKNTMEQKVVILIGNRTRGAAELAALDFRAIEGIILIGETTRGQVGMPRRFVVGGKNNGKQIKSYENPQKHKSEFSIDLPTRLCYDKDKKLIQWRGVKPDIKISSKKSAMGDNDLVLEKAIQLLS